MINVAALEAALALDVVRYSLAVTMQFVLVVSKASGGNVAANMKLAVADSRLGVQAITEAIGKTGTHG